MDNVKIILVDDHPIFSGGLSLLLENIVGLQVIGTAENGKLFLDLLEKLEPDLVLMDIRMPVMNGIDACREALLLRPGLKIIALTMFAEARYYRSMAEAGAHAFLPKNVSGAELEKAIWTVMGGQHYFSAPLMKNLLPGRKPSDSLYIAERNERLTEREHEVLRQIALGLSSQEIAEKLFISVRTVEGHRANLIAKTGTRNVVDLVIYAIRQGLISV